MRSMRSLVASVIALAVVACGSSSTSTSGTRCGALGMSSGAGGAGGGGCGCQLEGASCKSDGDCVGGTFCNGGSCEAQP